MFCIKCGATLDDDAIFCTNCGQPVERGGGEAPTSGFGATAPMPVAKTVITQQTAPVSVSTTQPVVMTPTPIGSAANQAPAPPRSPLNMRKVIIIAAAAVVLIAVIAIGAFALSTSSKNSSTTTNTGSTTSQQTNNSSSSTNSGSNSGSTTSTNGNTSTGTTTNNGATSTTTTSTTTTTSQNTALPSSNPYASYTADYIITDSDTRTLTDSDLSRLNAAQLKLARNEIYARRGRMFNDSDLAAYFNSRHWYRGTVPADSFQDSMLNDTERQNAEFIRAYEKSHGYN